MVHTGESRPSRLPDVPRASEQGGDAACWANLVCPECGAVEDEGHRAQCSRAAPANQ